MLTIDQVSVAYGESVVLSDVSLEVPCSGVTCLLGRNGVGKTTLLKAIMGVLPLRKGRVSLDGVDLSRLPPSERARAGVGYVPQGRGVFPSLTVRENLLIGLEALPRARRAAVALDEMYARFPVLGEMQGRAAGALSGGQQQQLALARALVRRPRALLLDEPTEGVQPSIIHEIAEVLRALGKQGELAILLVEQSLDFALGASTDYCIMETGGIAARGRTAAFDEQAAHEFLSL